MMRVTLSEFKRLGALSRQLCIDSEWSRGHYTERSVQPWMGVNFV